MKKIEIFEEVVDIMKHDSSTCKDITGGDVDIYRSKITEEMSDMDFLYVMQEYVATFEVKGHISFYETNSNINLDFKVQRYQDILYITDVATNSELKVGDKIVAVDGVPVKEFAELHKAFMYGEAEERQAYGWYRLLKFCKNVTIETENGQTKTFPIGLAGEWKKKERYFCKDMGNKITYMRLADFDNEEAIQKMYAENDALLSASEYLVIDVRGNGGGSDTAFFPLLKYCLPVGKKLTELDLQMSGVEVNYTERNCNSRLELISQYKQMELPEETLTVIEAMEAELLEQKGKGFVSDVQDIDVPVVGEEGVKHVYIITDADCASAGDAFIELMNASTRVTTVGRPTMGIQDYSNICMLELDKYTFNYPTSRLTDIDKGIWQMKKGVPVKVYVPWTPEFLERDIDIEKVYELIPS